MKKKILIMVVGLLLIGANLYAAGDLQVNGALGVGIAPPTSYKADLNTTNTRGLKVTATMNQNGVVGGDSVFGSLLKSEITGTATGDAGGISLLSVCSSNAANVNSVNGAGFVVSFGSSTAGTTNVNETNAGGFNTLLNPGNRNYNVTNGYGFKLSLFDNRSSGSGTLHYGNFKNVNIQNAANTYGALSVDSLSGIWIDKQTLGGTKNFGIVLNGDGAGADIILGASQNASIYASGGEIFVKDGASNVTQISPHDPETGEWRFYSKNVKTGRVVEINMEKLVKAVEKLTGEKFMIESIEGIN